jgi:diguanylate cyclase (GGDEF)-like protein/putative nucleotidyltransferase with HDIG domain
MLVFALGELAWLLQTEGLRLVSVFPSVSYYIYLGIYPFFIAAILLMPVRYLSLPARCRILLDSLLMLTILATFCYYYVIMPGLMGTRQGSLGKLVISAYPVADLILILCWLLVTLRSDTAALRPVLAMLGLAILLMLFINLFEVDEVLYRAYNDLTWVSFGWALVMILLTGAAITKGRYLRAQFSLTDASVWRAELVRSAYTLASWASWFPYLLALIFGLQVLLIWLTGNGQHLAGQISVLYVGSTIVLFLLVLRQILSLDEISHLQRDLQQTNSSLIAVNMILESLNERSVRLATLDSLTGIPNHRAMATRLEEQLHLANQQQSACSLIFLDIDHFKRLNDQYGHQTGDDVLMQFAQILQEVSGGTAGRWGGEEFLLILPGRDERGALELAERIRARVANHTFAEANGSCVWVTCSLGVAVYPQDARTTVELVECADEAMYLAKVLGRNQVGRASDPRVITLKTLKEAPEREKEESRIEVLRMLVALLERRDPELSAHSHRVSALAIRLARALAWSRTDIYLAGLAGLLHDLGKVALPDALLFKEEVLDQREYTHVKQHPVIGAEILGTMRDMRAVATIVRSHHEHMDGSGYPDQLVGQSIPPVARLLAVVDAYDAITTQRTYHTACSQEKAMRLLQEKAGSQFDGVIVEALVHLLAPRPSISQQPVSTY